LTFFNPLVLLFFSGNPFHNLNILLTASYVTKGYIILSSINAVSTKREYKAPKELNRAKRRWISLNLSTCKIPLTDVNLEVH